MKKNIFLFLMSIFMIVIFVVIFSCVPQPATLIEKIVSDSPISPSGDSTVTYSSSSSKTGTFNKIFEILYPELENSTNGSGTIDEGTYFLKRESSSGWCKISDKAFTFEAGKTYKSEVEITGGTPDIISDDFYVFEVNPDMLWIDCP